MAFNDLTSAAQEGLNYAAAKGVNGKVYASGKLYADALCELEGTQWFNVKQQALAERRNRLLNKPSNATLAAQVDALADTP